MNTIKTTSGLRGESWDSILQLSVWAGIIGPILYILVFTLDGALRPGYSAYREAASYLLLGSLGWIEIVNFIVFGCLLIVFAFGFFHRMSGVLRSGWLHISTCLLVLVGVGFFMAALFLPDPFGEPQHTLHAMLHNVAFIVVFFPLGVACVLIGSQLRKVVGWRIVGWYAMITGIPICFIALASFNFQPSTPPAWGGLFERIFFVIVFAWYVILASRMLKRESAYAAS